MVKTQAREFAMQEVTELKQRRISVPLLIFLLMPLTAITIAILMLVLEPAQGSTGAAANIGAQMQRLPYQAQDFEVQTLDGETVRLSDYRGRVVFLNFWATWCGPCIEELPLMQEFAAQQGDEGAVVLASTIESPDIVRIFSRIRKLKCPTSRCCLTWKNGFTNASPLFKFPSPISSMRKAWCSVINSNPSPQLMR